jgi:iron complex outermembrane recepter protein
MHYSLPAVGTVLPNPLGSMPLSRNFSNPDAPADESSAKSIGYQLEHKFSSNLSIRNTFVADFYKNPGKGIGFSTFLNEDNRTLDLFANGGDSDRQEYQLQTNVIAKIETGKIEQGLLLGLDLRRTLGDNTNGFFTLSDGSDIPSIDLFDPDPEFPELSDLQFTEDFNASFEDNYIAVYGQDLISFGEKLKLLLGGRYDWVTENFQDNLFGDFIVSKDSAFSPRVGIVYQPLEPVSLYAGYSRSFSPQGRFGNINADGTPFEPTKGGQFEAGVKTEFLDGKASATLAAYQITKTNINVDDPEREGFEIQIGEQRSRGIEFDLTGEPLPGLRLITAYAFTDAEVTDDPFFVGKQLENIPQHSGSIWAVYEVPKGRWQGFGIGTGVFAVGERQGDLDNTFTIPAYGRVDALLYYRRENWQAQLNFTNLFDGDYFESSGGRDSVSPGAPFTVRGQLSAEF